MRWIAVPCLLLLTVVAPSRASGEPSEVRVCVVAPPTLSSLRVSPEAERQQLLRAIEKEAGKSKVSVEAVPIRAGDAGLDDVREKNCQYKVAFRFEESYGFVPRYDTPYSTPATAQRDTPGTRRVSLIYSIDRVENDKRVDEGEIALRPGGNDEAAADRAVSDLSSRVVHAARKKH